MLKIGFCIDSLETGGAEKLLVDIVNALYETKDYEIHILTKLKSNSYFFNLIKGKIKYHFLLEKKSGGFFSKIKDSILKKINFRRKRKYHINCWKIRNWSKEYRITIRNS